MKGSDLAFLLEFGLFFGGAIAFAWWQFRSLKKLDEADAAKKLADEASAQNNATDSD